MAKDVLHENLERDNDRLQVADPYSHVNVREGGARVMLQEDVLMVAGKIVVVLKQAVIYIKNRFAIKC